MRWGLFNDAGLRPVDEAPLVFFGGFDKSIPLVLGLGGSTKNVIGHEGASSTYSRSTARAIVRWLLAGEATDRPPELPEWWDTAAEVQQVLAGVAIALHYLRPPTQNLTFLAKTLLTGTLFGHQHFTGVDKPRVVLGTPIFVSMAALSLLGTAVPRP